MSALYTPRFEYRRDDDYFHAFVDGFMLGAATVNRCRSVRQGFARTSGQIGRDGIENYMIQVFSSGRCHARAPHGDLVMNSSDICIFDNAQPLDTVNDDFDLLAIVVPRDRLAPLLWDPDAVHYGCVKGDTPLAGLLRAHLADLYRTAPDMRIEEVPGAFSALIHFLAAVINGGVDLTREQKALLRHGAITRIGRYVDANLDSDRLGIEDIADRFGLSRQRLCGLFERHGGIAAYVQHRRLAAAFAKLTDSHQPQRPINETAASVGFQSESGFVRAFRRQYGMTPDDARRSRGALLPAAASVGGPPHEHSWSDWLTQL